MDVPYAIQQYLLAQSGVTATVVPGGIFLLELPAAEDFLMPVQCAVIRGGGGGARFGSGTLQLNDQALNVLSYGQTPHLAWNVDSAIYQALKALSPSVWANTYLHWSKPLIRPIELRDPDTQWPYVVSRWQTLASDLTIA